jgi:hypothetical protein
MKINKVKYMKLKQKYEDDHVGLSECTSTHPLFFIKPVIFDGYNTTSSVIITEKYIWWYVS